MASSQAKCTYCEKVEIIKHCRGCQKEFCDKHVYYRTHHCSCIVRHIKKVEVPPPKRTLYFYLQTSTGGCHWIELPIMAKVRDLNEYIEQNLGISSESQRIVHNGSILWDKIKPLIDYGISNYSKVHLSLAMRGD